VILLASIEGNELRRMSARRFTYHARSMRHDTTQGEFKAPRASLSGMLKVLLTQACVQRIKRRKLFAEKSRN
jgi:hypothetical protein